MPVVLHDAQLARATGVSGRVSDLLYEDLTKRRLVGNGETVPTLPQVLGLVRGRVPVMVEIKSLRLRPGRIEPVVASVLDAYPGPVCVASFNPRTLAWFQQHRPEVARVMTAGPLAGFPLPVSLRRRLANLRDVTLLRPAAVSYELAGLPSAATDRWRNSGRPLLTWTVAGHDDLQRAQSLADNVIFEHVRP
jgi:glycerophosphoryl diester phosphodiesterase